MRTGALPGVDMVWYRQNPVQQSYPLKNDFPIIRGRCGKGRAKAPVTRAKAKKGDVLMSEEDKLVIKQRTNAVNSQRERIRMKFINAGLDRLRERVPTRKPPGKQLTKVETLRAAIDYIRQLMYVISISGGYDTRVYAPAPNYSDWMRQEAEQHQQKHQQLCYNYDSGVEYDYWQPEDQQMIVHQIQ